MDNSLAHFGILGMRWGVRRTDEQLAARQARKAEDDAYRQKAAKVADNEYAQASDRRRAKYASKSTAGRIATTATSIVARKAIGMALTGGFSNISKRRIASEIADAAALTAVAVVKNDLLAKSAMKNYTNKGTTVPGTKRSSKIITKEDLIDSGVQVGMAAASIAAQVGALKMTQMKFQRQENEKRFQSWGQNILPQSTDTLSWMDNAVSSDNFRVLD